MWEDVVLSQGADFYKTAMVDLDRKTLAATRWSTCSTRIRKIQEYFDAGRTGRDWNLATAMVINGKAGMQFMGDWAKGEFAKAGQKSGIGLRLRRFPGTEKSVHVQRRLVRVLPGRKARRPHSG